jgi:hypothetical protein
LEWLKVKALSSSPNTTKKKKIVSWHYIHIHLLMNWGSHNFSLNSLLDTSLMSFSWESVARETYSVLWEVSCYHFLCFLCSYNEICASKDQLSIPHLWDGLHNKCLQPELVSWDVNRYEC